MKLEKKHYAWGVATIAIILIIIFWKQISSLWSGSDSGTTGGATHRVASSLGRLNSQEKMIVDKYSNDIKNLGVKSIADVQTYSSQIQEILNNMNKSFRNIGSTASVQYNGASATSRTKCADVAVNRNCTGYVGILFGTACITWGCQNS